MSSFTENLGLVKHASGYEGWADDMNANLDKIDTGFNRITHSSNPLINGDMGVWQRGTHISTSGFVADRWYLGNAWNAMMSRQEFIPGQTDVPGEPKYYLNTNIVTAGDYCYFQPIEDVRSYFGETISFDFWTYVDSPTTLEFVLFSQNFGSGGSDLVHTLASLDNSVLSAGWNNVTGYVTIPSVAGKTICDGSYLSFRIDINPSYTGNWGLSQVSINLGSTSYPFKSRPPALEEMLCQRYYCKSYEMDVDPGTVTEINAEGDLWSTGADVTGYLSASFRYPVPMRVSPTLTIYDIAGSVGYLSGHNQSGSPINGIRLTGIAYSGTKGAKVYSYIPGVSGLECHYTADAELY